METLPFEILQYICDLLPTIRDKLTLISLSKSLLAAGDDGLITQVCSNRLTDEILGQPKFSKLTSLWLCSRSRSSLNGQGPDPHNGKCEVSQKGISKLIELKTL